MAIKAGIEVDAILWKYTQMEREYRYDYEKRTHEHVDIERYYYIKLTTRRGRTNGWNIGKDIFPFFKSIGIKLIQRYEYDSTKFIAVGTMVGRSENKAAWDRLVIDETAQRWYSRIKKKDMKLLLENAHDSLSAKGLEEMKKYLTDDTSEVDNWPPEDIHPVKNMTVSEYFISPVDWN
mgnify:CR=1 FL=1